MEFQRNFKFLKKKKANLLKLQVLGLVSSIKRENFHPLCQPLHAVQTRDFYITSDIFIVKEQQGCYALLFNIHGVYFLIECDLHCYNLSTISLIFTSTRFNGVNRAGKKRDIGRAPYLTKTTNLQYRRLNAQYLLKTGETLSAESLIVYPYAKV